MDLPPVSSADPAPLYHQLNLPGVSSSSLRYLSGKEWSSSCEFFDLEESAVLKKVLETVERVQPSVVLLDLDSTLYEVEHRSSQILTEWSRSEESAPYAEVREKLRDLPSNQVGYSVKDTFFTLGLDLSQTGATEALESAKRFWSSRFFGNHYLHHDRPYPGAVQFVQQLHQRGTQIVYLTGRDQERMHRGTVENLKRDGFPWGGSSVHLWMKPSKKVSDLDFKTTAALRVRELGVLVASFENEPRNLMGVKNLYPEAIHVFVDTLSSDHPAPVGSGIYRIRGFGL